MTLTPEQFFSQARQLRITPARTQTLRTAVVSFVEDHPLPTRPSLWARWRWALASSAAGLASLTGIAVAAQSAIPGDVLYNVKIRVNERIRNVIAVSPQAQADVAAQQLQQRLVEAEHLADQRRLGESNRQALEQSVAKSTSVIQTQISALKESAGQSAALKVTEDVSATITEHETSLKRVAEQHPDQRESVERFVEQIQREREQLLTDREDEGISTDEDTDSEPDDLPSVETNDEVDHGNDQGADE